MFLDESGFNTAMTRLYARAPSRLRAVGRVARNHGLNQTLICGLRLAGPVAPLVIPGAVNGDTFECSVPDNLIKPRSALEKVESARRSAR